MIVLRVAGVTGVTTLKIKHLTLLHFKNSKCNKCNISSILCGLLHLLHLRINECNRLNLIKINGVTPVTPATPKNSNIGKIFLIMFQLEKYKSEKSRHVCPACGVRRVFARYVDADTGEYLSNEVGRCNRESKCGYHFTPKDYFAANPNAAEARPAAKKTRSKSAPAPISAREKNKDAFQPDYIDSGILKKTLTNYENNSFVHFLFDLFIDSADLVRQSIKAYSVGTTREGKTVFWQIDRAKRIRTGKIIAYDAATGKRRKDIPPTWVHSELKRAGLVKEEFNLMQCFFGEHLLDDVRPAAIVEAEKTAIIASIVFPEFVWLAVGAKLTMKVDRLRSLGKRKIILYPDADGYKDWQETAHKARRLGLPVNVSSLIEAHATSEQKSNGYDLADYLIDEQYAIKEHNAFTDRYNDALECVQQNPTLMNEVNRRIDSHIARLMRGSNLTRTQADNEVMRSNTVRSIVIDVASSSGTNAASSPEASVSQTKQQKVFN